MISSNLPSILKSNSLTGLEFLTLIKCKFPEIDYTYNLEDLISLQNKGFIKIVGEKVLFRHKGSLLFKKEVLNEQVDENFDSFVLEFRSLFKGLKLGSMGSYSTCKDNLQRWMRENPSFSKEDILKATKIYIDSLSNYTYLSQAHYFVYKKEGKSEVSKLSAFIEEINSKTENDDWTSELC